MKKTPLLISALLLAALGGVVWWSNKDEARKEKEPKKDDTPAILSLNEGDITGIEIHSREGETTVLKKDVSTNRWSITAPKPYAADQAAVAGLTSPTANLRGERLLEENLTDLKSYGMDNPAVTIAFIDKNGKASKLLIGDGTPTDNNVYAMLEGSKRLYTMAGLHSKEFAKSVKDLREKHLLMAEQDKLSRLEVVSKAGTVEFGHSGEGWQILKPSPMRADGAQVEEVLRKVREAQLDPETPEAASFPAGATVATVRVTDSTGTKSLEIHKVKDDCYAKSSTMEGVYKTGKELCEGLDKPVDGYRNKKLFAFGFADPVRVEFTDSGKSTIYEKDKEEWKSAGKSMDSVGVQNLIDKLRDASASKLVSSGFTTPAMVIKVSADEGKINERVQISSSGDSFFATRDNDTTIYQVDKGVVEDIRRAAGGIQPAQKSDKKQ